MTALAQEIQPEAIPAVLTMKGVGFSNIYNYVTQKHSQAAWDTVLGQLSRADAETVRGAVAVGWYDVYLFGRLLQAVDKVCGKGDLGLMHEIGVFECEQDFNRVFRVFLKVLSPTALMRAEARLWKHFQSAGIYQSEATANGMVTTLREWAVDTVLCTELGAYLQRLVTFTVSADVQMVHTKCRARGDDCCAYHFAWKRG